VDWEVDMLKKVLTWSGIALLVWFIVSQPQSAASVVRSMGTGLQDIAEGFGTFVSNLA